MSSPKRTDVVGSPEQAFGHGKNVLDYIIGGIKSRSIAAILYVSPTGHLQAVYAPQLHTGLDGAPISIIGNASGKLDKFSLVELDLDQLGMLPCFTKTDPSTSLDGITITKALLKDTKWKNDTLFGTAIPNVTIIYFGVKVPTGTIMTDDAKHELALLGPGYEIWAQHMSKSVQYEEDASRVMGSSQRKGCNLHQIPRRKAYQIRAFVNEGRPSHIHPHSRFGPICASGQEYPQSLHDDADTNNLSTDTK